MAPLCGSSWAIVVSLVSRQRGRSLACTERPGCSSTSSSPRSSWPRRSATEQRSPSGYHPPQTPCERLLGAESVPSSAKEKLLEISSKLDPLQLLDRDASGAGISGDACGR